MNDIKLLGRFTETPVLKTTLNNISVTSFSFAVPRGYKGKNGEEITDFFTCVAWRQTAEFITKYFTKGAPALVSGSLEARKYEDKQGNKRTAYEIRVEKIYFAGSKKDNNTETPPACDFEEIPDDEDLPF